MYGYHNGLTAPHPASSPWWAWPMDLKPVWFYQDGFANGTTAAIYDAGNLVIWWLSIPAMIFTAVMAYRRKSLALALITIGFAAQWVPWARIERAAFQYHYYTALPFLILALAYFVAELWHGPSRRTWLVARIAAGLAIVGPALMWVFSRPLCWFVDVQSVNPGSQACPAVIPELVVTVRSLALLGVVVVGVVVLGRAILALGEAAPEADGEGDADPRRADAGPLRAFLLPAIGVAIGFAIAALLPDTPILTLTDLPVEPIALVVGLPLGYLAAQVWRRATPIASWPGCCWPSWAGSRSSTRTSRRCPCPRPSPAPTRACCRPTCTRSSSRSAPATGTWPRRCSARPWPS